MHRILLNGKVKHMSTASKPGSRAEATHGAILDAAASCFSALGFARASMDRIASEAGVTKPTVYAHFGDKAALFEESIRRQLASYNDRPVAPAATRDEAAEALLELSRDYLEWLHAEPRFGLLRAAASETMRRPEWAQSLLAGLDPSSLIIWLGELHAAGIADVADPEEAAELHHALLKGATFYPALLGLIPVPNKADRERAAQAATAAFLIRHPRPDRNQT